MRAETFLSVVGTMYYKSDTSFDSRGLPDTFFHEIKELLGLTDIPLDAKKWMKEHSSYKKFYDVPPITEIVDDYIKTISDNTSDAKENIIVQLKQSNKDENYRIEFADGTKHKVDRNISKQAIYALRSDKIKPETRLEFQNYCKQSLSNLVKFAKMSKQLGV